MMRVIVAVILVALFWLLPGCDNTTNSTQNTSATSARAPVVSVTNSSALVGIWVNGDDPADELFVELLKDGSQISYRFNSKLAKGKIMDLSAGTWSVKGNKLILKDVDGEIGMGGSDVIIANLTTAQLVVSFKGSKAVWLKQVP